MTVFYVILTILVVSAGINVSGCTNKGFSPNANSPGGKSPQSAQNSAPESGNGRISQNNSSDKNIPEIDASSIKPGNTPPVFRNKKDGSVLILIPAGEFVMGAGDDDKEAKQNEKPAHKVKLDAYYINKYEVTYRQFKNFLKKSGYKPVGNWNRFDSPEFLDHPVMNVTFLDADAYCRWAGLNLPSEAQWEMAARGTDGRKYPWGNNWDPNKCNNPETNDPEILKKMNNIQDKRGSLPPGSIASDISPYGIMDMAGNINEWCGDWYISSYYKKAPYYNPEGPDKSAERSIKGGAWSLPPARCRASARWSGSVESDLDDYGFRCGLKIKSRK